MKDKIRRQNKREAQTFFGNDLTKNFKDRYNVHKIDSDAFNLGMEYGFNTSVNVIPSEYKDNLSFVEGYQRAKRILQNQIDLYNMGRKKYFEGIDIDLLSQNYRNSEYFMSGYNDAKNMAIENEELQGRKRR